MCYDKELADHLIELSKKDWDVREAVENQSPRRLKDLLEESDSFKDALEEGINGCTCDEGQMRKIRFVLHESARIAKAKMEKQQASGGVVMAS